MNSEQIILFYKQKKMRNNKKYEKCQNVNNLSILTIEKKMI
jgi:hypothetical protein